MDYATPPRRTPRLVVAGIALLALSAVMFFVPWFVIRILRVDNPNVMPLIAFCWLGHLPMGLLGLVFTIVGFFRSKNRN